MKLRQFLIWLAFIICSSYSFAQDTTAIYQLKVGDLNVGIDVRRLLTTYDSSRTYYSSFTGGLSLRYQSSLVFNYYNKRPTKKFKVGDLLSGEVCFGGINSNDPIQNVPFWFAYRFEMGIAFLYRNYRGFDAGVNLILLRFARDYVTQNISGSGIDLRFRVLRIVVEGGLHARQLRIIGFPVPFFNNREEPNIIHVGFRYLINSSLNLGARVEWLDRNISHYQDGIFNVRVYYGKYF